jgi:chromosome segregation ATPase
MNENTTTIMQSDLDRLTERVEKAAALVTQLRDERARFECERDEVGTRLRELESRLQGQDAAGLVQEVQNLRKEQREWIAERREVANRIEALIKKLEGLEV